MLRSLVLFVHIASSMGLFAALGIEGASLLQLRRASEPARLEAALSGYRWVRPVGGAGMMGTILSGAYLASTAWGWRTAWIDVALGGVVLLAVMGGTMTGLRIARLQKGVRDGTVGLPGLPARDPVLWLSFRTRVAILIGILFLMATKPGWQGSFVAMAVAVAAGLLASLADFQGRGAPVTSEGKGAAR
ncbi:MAG: hypothetical protein H0T50_04010 [Gemmatimonadales bacterium]|nr:hypothetical protein [Gemmatimonadales bacterium]